jgi:pilus assembly protein TadC
MLLKIYLLIWVLGLLAVGVFYLTGNLNQFMQVVFGFLTFGMIFMGMIAVLPFAVTHQTPTKH